MALATTYVPNQERYVGAKFRRCGESGVMLPPVSLGLWQNFGDNDVFEVGRAVLRRAFDRGVTHFDLANNYGPPYGAGEMMFGRVMHHDFRSLRNEMMISTKAGWDMWPGPYGDGGSKKYLVASLDESLQRMGLEYVDIFYHHRPDFDTPMEETADALAGIVRAGKALYVGISSYSPERTQTMFQLLKERGVKLLIHQPSYSMLNRGIEAGLLQVLEELSVGCIAFSPLAQGLLTDKYIRGNAGDARLHSTYGSFTQEMLSDENLVRVRALNEIAKGRGQTLAQMAIAWALRDRRITSVLIGARNVTQLDNSLDAIAKLAFSAEELAEIDNYAVDTPSLDLWRSVSAL